MCIILHSPQEILTEPVLPVLTEVSLPTEGSLSTENKFSLVNLIDNAVEPKTIFVKSFDVSNNYYSCIFNVVFCLGCRILKARFCTRKKNL